MVGGAGLEEISARSSRSSPVVVEAPAWGEALGWAEDKLGWAEDELGLGEADSDGSPADGALRASGEADPEFTAISGPRSTALGRAEAMATPTAASTATIISATAAFSPAPVSFMPTMVPCHDEPMMRRPTHRMRNR